MIAIFGLGNVGDKYKNTRHNIGFIFADKLAQKRNLSFSNMGKLEAQIAKGENVIFAKPQTMMNSSGDAIRLVSRFYSVDSESIYIIHDDLDLPLGEYKIQFGKGPKIHNGVNSIEESLGTNNFGRVRIGVDNRDPENRIKGEAYVLSDFLEAEKRTLEEVFKKVSEDIDKIL